MNKKKIIIIGSIIVLIIIILLSPVMFTEQLYNLAISSRRKQAGLEKKIINIDDFKICYLEGGKGKDILLIHGFGADKDNWIYLSKYLTSNYHVIALDLPGFGESTKLKELNYDVISQIKRINLFVDKIGLRTFIIAGNSMGGHIAAAYSINYPDKASLLCLIDTSGIKLIKKNDNENDDNIFNIKSVGDYDRLMSFAFSTPPKLPVIIKKYLVKKAIKNNELNKIIKKQLSDNPYPLEPVLNQIDIPVLIIWGDNDKLLDISIVSVLESKLKKYKTVIIKNCGHVPMVEKPEEMANALIEFLK